MKKYVFAHIYAGSYHTVRGYNLEDAMRRGCLETGLWRLVKVI